MKIEIDKHIIIDPKICHGKPTFKGTRIMVWQVLEMVETGTSTKDIIEAFPSLTPKAIKAALHYAVTITRGTNNVVISVGA